MEPYNRARATRSNRSQTSALFHDDCWPSDDASLYGFSIASAQVQAEECTNNKGGDQRLDWDVDCESLFTTDDESLYTTISRHPMLVDRIPKEFLDKYASNNLQATFPKDMLGTMSKDQLVQMLSVVMSSNDKEVAANKKPDPPTTQPQPGEIQVDLSSLAKEPKYVTGAGEFLPPWLNKTPTPDCSRATNTNTGGPTTLAQKSAAEIIREVYEGVLSPSAIASKKKLSSQLVAAKQSHPQKNIGSSPCNATLGGSHKGRSTFLIPIQENSHHDTHHDILWSTAADNDDDDDDDDDDEAPLLLTFWGEHDGEDNKPKKVDTIKKRRCSFFFCKFKRTNGNKKSVQFLNKGPSSSPVPVKYKVMANESPQDSSFTQSTTSLDSDSSSTAEKETEKVQTSSTSSRPPAALEGVHSKQPPKKIIYEC